MSAEDGFASVVFRGGRVYTVEVDQPWAEAVAVRDGVIVAAGSNAEVDALAGPGTTIIELDGRMVLPGSSRRTPTRRWVRSLPVGSTCRCPRLRTR